MDQNNAFCRVGKQLGLDNEPKKELSLISGRAYRVDDKEVLEAAEALHNSLAFYLKRYEGVEITTGQDVYGIAKKPWSQICATDGFAKEWLCRVAMDMLEHARLDKGGNHG
ncbi:MAG: hypothetical protein IPL86_17185 [Flavobacteriales bacterium]|nr:hypothetical protein [Flavobacteriales bacterium]